MHETGIIFIDKIIFSVHRKTGFLQIVFFCFIEKTERVLKFAEMILQNV